MARSKLEKIVHNTAPVGHKKIVQSTKRASGIPPLRNVVDATIKGSVKIRRPSLEKTDGVVKEIQKILVDSTLNGMPYIKTGTLKRVMTKGGVAHLSRTSFKPIRDQLGAFMYALIKGSQIYATCSRRKTITAVDIAYALRRLGHTLYQG